MWFGMWFGNVLFSKQNIGCIKLYSLSYVPKYGIENIWSSSHWFV